jgi:hypothetical protein
VAQDVHGRRSLNELIADPTTNVACIATRDGCSVRKVNMTISLAFLAPEDLSTLEKVITAAEVLLLTMTEQ